MKVGIGAFILIITILYYLFIFINVEPNSKYVKAKQTNYI